MSHPRGTTPVASKLYPRLLLGVLLLVPAGACREGLSASVPAGRRHAADAAQEKVNARVAISGQRAAAAGAVAEAAAGEAAARERGDGGTGAVQPERPLAQQQAALLAEWYAVVGTRRLEESFGQLVARAGVQLVGRPYDSPPQRDEPEELRVELASVDCVSFIESSLALARCTWQQQRDNACFVRELEALRYRGGNMDGFSSRLHYFVEWLDDNARRQRLRMLTEELGGRPVQHSFAYMTSNPTAYPALARPAVLQEISLTERRLSAAVHAVIPRDNVERAQARLQSGDVVALVSSRRPGMMIAHTGLVLQGADGKPRLLHASRHHGRVLAMAGDLAGYVTSRPDRRGIMVARPLPP